MKKLATALVGGALIAALAVPASSLAVDFGADLSATTPNIALSCLGSCTTWNSLLPAAQTQGTLLAPITGVVVSFTVKGSGTNWSPVHLRVINQVTAPDTFAGLGSSSPDVVPTATTDIQSFPVRVPITVGDFIGLEGTTAMPRIAAMVNTLTNANQRIAQPALPTDGSPFDDGTASPPDNRAVGLQARVEPDADNDGFGDETQDKCPGVAGPNAGCPPTAVTTTKKCKKKKQKKHKSGTQIAKKKCKKKHH